MLMACGIAYEWGRETIGYKYANLSHTLDKQIVSPRR